MNNMIISNVATKRNRKQLNAEEIAMVRRSQGEKIAERLKSVAPIDSIAAAKAYRIAKCAESRNIFIADNLQNKDGEFYKGTGNRFACNERLCTSCNAKKARESRRKGRRAVTKIDSIFDKKTKQILGLRWRSVLLTQPLMKGSDPIAATERIQRAFGLMIDRTFWKSRVKGGIKGVEFTVRTTGNETKGFHVHIHLLLLSKFIAVDADKAKQFERHLKKFNLSDKTLQGEWRYCLNKAGASQDSRLSYKRLVVSVMDTKNHSERIRGDKTNESAILETAAYMCKFESWQAISDKDLLRIAEIERWNRMFETLGAGRESYDESKDELGEINDRANADASLVPNPNLKSGNKDSSNKTLDSDKKFTWRTRFKSMTFDAWKRWQASEIEKIQAFRRRQLALMNPLANFMTLDGEYWDFEMVDDEMILEQKCIQEMTLEELRRISLSQSYYESELVSV
jgi:hypothetical protein